MEVHISKDTRCLQGRLIDTALECGGDMSNIILKGWVFYLNGHQVCLLLAFPNVFLPVLASMFVSID